MRVLPTAFTAAAFALLLSACTVQMPNTAAPEPETEPTAVSSDACIEAFAEADPQVRAHYETGPLQVYYETAPALPETDEEWADYEAAVAEDEAAFSAIVDPLYTECQNPEQFVEGARAYPFVVGLTGPEFVDEITLMSYCSGREETPACTDYESFEF